MSCPSGCPTDCSKAVHLLQFFFVCTYVGYCNCVVVSCPTSCSIDCSKEIHLLQFFFVCMSIIATVSLCLVPQVVLLTVPRRFICCCSSLLVCRLLQLCRCVLSQWLSYWLFQGNSSVSVLLCLYVDYCNSSVVSCPSGCPTDYFKAVHLFQFFFVCMSIIATVSLCLAPVVVLLTAPRRFIWCSSSLFVCCSLQLCRCVLSH